MLQLRMFSILEAELVLTVELERCNPAPPAMVLVAVGVVGEEGLLFTLPPGVQGKISSM